MKKNLTTITLTSTGTWTVPAGVTSVKVYAAFNGSGSIDSGGNSFSLVRNQSGTVYSFGDNTFGQLGDGTVANQSTPVPVVGGYSFVQVSTGTDHCLAIESDGKAYAWGSNKDVSLFRYGSGKLGDGTVVDKSSPVPVSGTHSFIQVSCSNDHSLALKSNGQVYAWGNNGVGQLGDGTVVAKSTPVLVSGGHSFIKIAGGGAHSLALKSNGQVYAWGNNLNRQLGDGTVTSRSSPVPIAGTHSFIQVAGGYTHSLALKSDGSVYAWGTNSSGQLGDGTVVAKSTPVLVSGHSFVDIGCNKNWTTGLAVINSHSIAHKSNGEVLTWGGNLSGQLGDGTIIGKSTPVYMNAIAAGPIIVTDLSASSLRYTCDVTPGEQIPYKASGLSPNYFGDYPIGADLTEIVITYFS